MMARSEIAEVVRIKINQLCAVVATLVDLGHRDDNRLGTQIHPDIGIRRIGVRSNELLILRGRHPRGVTQSIERRLEGGAFKVHRLLVERLVASHDREAIDERLFGDRACQRRLSHELSEIHECLYGLPHWGGLTDRSIFALSSKWPAAPILSHGRQRMPYA